MRIAIFTETYYPFISGVVTHIEALKNNLEANGHEVLIVTLNPDAKKHYMEDGILYCPAVPLKKIYGFGVANPMNLKRLSLVKRFRPDVIHIQTEFSMGIFGLYVAKHLNLPVVYTLHTMYDDYVFYVVPENMGKVAQPAARAYINNVASKADEIIGPSKKVADYMAACGVGREINLIPNTVETAAFLPENVPQMRADTIQKRLGIQPGDVCICFVGRLGKEKSIDVLIEHFAKSFGGEAPFKLFILGDGPERESLAQQISGLGVGGQVKLLGHVEHSTLPAYYQAFNLFSTASLTEMNSISLLEATASGLYAITRLDEQNRDQIVTGQNGEVFETREEFEAAVRKYAKNSAEEKEKIKQNVSNYSKRYGPKEFIEKVEKVYDKAIENHTQKQLQRY